MAQFLRLISIFLFLFAFLFLFRGSGYSQCSPSIPSGAIVVNGTTIHGNSDQSVWVCEGSDFSIYSDAGAVNNVVVYAEENTFIDIQNDHGADGNVVYAKSGSVVTVGQNATSTTVRKESGVTFVDQGTSTSTVTCSSLNFDLSNAPQNGCQAVSLNERSGSASGIKVHNMGDRIRVIMPKELINTGESFQVKIYDMLGKEVHSRSIGRSQETFDPGLPSGIYHYLLRKDGQAFDSGKLGLR